MPEEYISLPLHPGFFLRRMRSEDVDAVKKLSDDSVGKDLYLREELLALVDDADSHFFLLFSESVELAGYVYFYLTDRIEAERRAKLPSGAFLPLSEAGTPLGHVQSISIAPQFRSLGLSTQLIRFASERLLRLGASLAFVICWKAGETVPLAMTMHALHFRLLAETEDVWYDNPHLVCPLCAGRCRCRAEVYYRQLKEEII